MQTNAILLYYNALTFVFYIPLLVALIVFYLYTGLAFIDVYNLRPEHISEDSNGNLWIVKAREKTNNLCNIPLLSIPKQILEKYKDNPYCLDKGVMLPVPCNQLTNSYLKEIADLCGIRKNLTTHTARHSFATLICLSNGVPIETISKMMGHYSIRTTQIYAEITNHKVSRDLETLSENTKGKYALPDDGMPSRVFKCGNYSGWKKKCESSDRTKMK